METNSENLCLDLLSFSNEHFNVDYYLSTHMQKCDLVSLRKELRKYGSQLHNETINILKTETKSIVHFVENLCMLQSKISELSYPIFQFKEEIRTINDFISKTKDNYKTLSNKLCNYDREKQIISFKIRIITSIIFIRSIIENSDLSKDDITTLEWLVNEYSFQINYLKELENNYVDFENDLIEIENNLKDSINKSFFKAISEKEEKVIICCLRIYQSLSEQREAEKVVREKIVKPKLQIIFSQENLDKNSQDLNKLYNEALQILKDEVNILHTLINQYLEVTGFNFVINSFWKEVDIELIEGLSNITAPGNPGLFQKRFKYSWIFLQEIIKYDPNSVINKHQYYEAHMKRFNLPVYFEIRYQQIGAKLEESLLNYEKNSVGEEPFYLQPTNVLWNCLSLCFSEDVFLEHLSDQFVRLSILILSRFLKWIEGETFEEGSKKNFEYFLIHSLTDLNTLQSKVGYDVNENPETSIYYILPEKIRKIMVKIFRTNGSKIEKTQNVVKDFLIHKKLKSVDIYLQQVRSIPRIYRKTNRGSPKTPSSYATELINDLCNFYQSHKHTGILDNILNSIVEKISEKYLDLIKEVLRSVSETEKSLRRLKNRSLTNTEEFFNSGVGASDAVSDETKIKDQIKIDMDYYLKGIKNLPLQLQSPTILSFSRVDFWHST